MFSLCYEHWVWSMPWMLMVWCQRCSTIDRCSIVSVSYVELRYVHSIWSMLSSVLCAWSMMNAVSANGLNTANHWQTQHRFVFVYPTSDMCVWHIINTFIGDTAIRYDQCNVCWWTGAKVHNHWQTQPRFYILCWVVLCTYNATIGDK